MGITTAPVSGSGSWPAWMARVSKSMAASLASHRLETELPREPGERPLERLGAAEASLGVPRPHGQRARLSVGLDVGPAHDPVTAEQRQDVVAKPPLRRGFVHLDQVLEAEQPARRTAGPRAGCRRGTEAPLPPARRPRDRHRPRPAPRDRRHPPPRRRTSPAAITASTCGRIPARPAPQPAVLDESRPRSARRGRGRRAATRRRSTSSSSGTGALEHLVGHHPFGQVVHALEPLPAGDRELAGAPQVPRASAWPASAPHPARPLSLEVARPEERPRSRMSAPDLARPGRARSRSPAPTSGCERVSMNRRISGHASIGSRHASCAQYSKRRPSRSSADTVPSG